MCRLAGCWAGGGPKQRLLCYFATHSIYVYFGCFLKLKCNEKQRVAEVAWVALGAIVARVAVLVRVAILTLYKSVIVVLVYTYE